MVTTPPHCMHCGKSFIVGHNPQQKYCSLQLCQNARKRLWRRRKLSSDSGYRENQRAANRKWQSRNPDYWRRYREQHPEYTKGNVARQKLRRQILYDASQVAKSDASPPSFLENNSMKPGTYQLVLFSELPVATDIICVAKSDASLVTIGRISMV